ncbi:MAG: rRNA maturation RNase YbeY [Candidatus Kapabacteria bacterium]|nr:rRNA maturation RNase YbeY [Ignavibacteriota bacterium]MCW5886148.1 rRNA maturation RNase YbeY [Candidatus Kapabacteria bacterium]
MIEVNIYNESTHKYLPSKLMTQAVLKVAEREIKKTGEISIIICSDSFIHELNINFLNHDYATDVITFEIESNPLVGEIYISADTAKLQALDYGVPFRDELLRLSIHGTLHLAGYKDDSEEEKRKMTIKEDFYLQMLKEGN